ISRSSSGAARTSISPPSTASASPCCKKDASWRSISTACPPSEMARARRRWRRSLSRVTESIGASVRLSLLRVSGFAMSIVSSSKQEVALRHGKLGGGSAGEKLAVRAHFVCLGIHIDFGRRAVVNKTRLANAARVLHRDQSFGQAQPLFDAGTQRRL